MTPTASHLLAFAIAAVLAGPLSASQALTSPAAIDPTLPSAAAVPAQTPAGPSAAATTPAPATATVSTTSPPADSSPKPVPSVAPAARAYPPMLFASSVAVDEIYELLKARPGFEHLDKETSGTPLYLLVTHSVRPTSGGAAAGMVTGLLAATTLGLIPTVTNEEFVVRYEVWLQGRPISSYSFTRTKTRASNMWSGASAEHHGLGREGLEWIKSTVDEFAAKLAADPELARVQADIDYYFPAPAVAPK